METLMIGLYLKGRMIPPPAKKASPFCWRSDFARRSVALYLHLQFALLLEDCDIHIVDHQRGERECGGGPESNVYLEGPIAVKDKEATTYNAHVCIRTPADGEMWTVASVEVTYHGKNLLPDDYRYSDFQVLLRHKQALFAEVFHAIRMREES
jgi:hypothetical protein